MVKGGAGGALNCGRVGQDLPPLQEEDDQVPGGGGGEVEQHDVRAVVVPRGGAPLKHSMVMALHGY